MLLRSALLSVLAFAAACSAPRNDAPPSAPPERGASVKPGGTTMATIMLTAMMVMVFAFWAYAIGMALVRARALILEREKRSQWVADMLAARR